MSQKISEPNGATRVSSSSTLLPQIKSIFFNSYTVTILVAGGYILSRELLGWQLPSLAIVTTTTALSALVTMELFRHCIAPRVPDPMKSLRQGLFIGTTIGLISGVAIATLAEESFQLLHGYFY